MECCTSFVEREWREDNKGLVALAPCGPVPNLGALGAYPSSASDCCTPTHPMPLKPLLHTTITCSLATLVSSRSACRSQSAKPLLPSIYSIPHVTIHSHPPFRAPVGNKAWSKSLHPSDSLDLCPLYACLALPAGTYRKSISSELSILAEL